MLFNISYMSQLYLGMSLLFLLTVYLFHKLSICSYLLLAHMVSDESSAINLTKDLIYMMSNFPLASFKNIFCICLMRVRL